MSEEVKSLVDVVDLMQLVQCLLTMHDTSLLYNFVEQCHKEASSFYLSFGDTTITMDNVFRLFHILIVGNFFIPLMMSVELDAMNVKTYLGLHEEYFWRSLSLT